MVNKNLKNNYLNNFINIFMPEKSFNFIYFLSLFYLFNLSLTIIFGRPFVGLMIFNQQLGKAYVLAGAISIGILLILKYGNLILLDKKFKAIINVLLFISISFIVSLFLNGFRVDLYIFKSSSYIWSLGYCVLGYYFLKNIKRELILFVIFCSAFGLYFASIINYPNFIIDIFISNSDKFQLIKAADSLLIFVILNFFFEKYSKFDNRYKFLILMSSFGMFLPYYIYQSRGSLLASVLFFVLSLISYRKFILKNLLLTFFYSLISFVLFYISSYSIAFISLDDSLLPDTFSEANSAIVDNILTEKEPRKGFLTFYIDNGRLQSLDATTNWRLDIWQDLTEDLSSKDKLFFGFGYLEPFEIMNDPSEPGRLGRDGLNEHVHNYFFNIIGRGGLLQLFLFLLFYFYIFRIWINKNLSILDFLKFFAPILIVSSLDVTMEGVHFPFIFLSFLGYILSHD